MDIDKVNSEIDRLTEQKNNTVDDEGNYVSTRSGHYAEWVRDLNSRIDTLKEDKQDYENFKAADEFKEKYANDPEFKAQVDAYNAKRDEFKSLPYLLQPSYFYADAIPSGVMQAAKTANDTLKMGYDFLEPLLVPEDHRLDNPVKLMFDSNAQTYENAERNHDMMKYAYDNELLSKLSDGTASAIASLPMYAAAVATGGASAAGQMLTAGTYNAATANTAKMLSHSLSALLVTVFAEFFYAFTVVLLGSSEVFITLAANFGHLFSVVLLALFKLLLFFI